MVNGRLLSADRPPSSLVRRDPEGYGGRRVMKRLHAALDERTNERENCAKPRLIMHNAQPRRASADIRRGISRSVRADDETTPMYERTDTRASTK